MKIIKIGTKRNKIWSGTCKNCGTKAEAEEHELTITHSQRDGDCAWHKCPHCETGPYGGMLFYQRDR